MSNLPPTCAGVVEGTGTLDACGGKRVLFLDRDGVINVNLGYVHTPERTSWIPGIFELCAAARDKGYAIIIATNQAGIARGYYDVPAFEQYTRWMHAQFSERGIPVVATLFCPHHPTAGNGPFTTPCGCRKPATGMFRLAHARYGANMAESILVGDKISDMQAGHDAGIGRLWLLEGDIGAGAAPTGVVCYSSLSRMGCRL